MEIHFFHTIRNITKGTHYVLFYHYLEPLVNAIRKEEIIKSIQIGKKEAKLSPFLDNKRAYLKISRVLMLKITNIKKI